MRRSWVLMAIWALPATVLGQKGPAPQPVTVVNTPGVNVVNTVPVAGAVVVTSAPPVTGHVEVTATQALPVSIAAPDPLPVSMNGPVTVANPTAIPNPLPVSGTVNIGTMPPVTVSTTEPGVRTVTIRAVLTQNTPNSCQSLFSSQSDPQNPSGQIWLIEAVNGRIYAPSESQVPVIQLLAEAPDPNVAGGGFFLDTYYLGIHRTKVSFGGSDTFVNYVFNDRLNVYAVKSQQIYPALCFAVPVDYVTFVEVTFTGRLLTCAAPQWCP